MISEFAAGQHDPAPIHPGILAAVTAVEDALGALFVAHQALRPPPDDAADPSLAASGAESLPSLLRPDPAAARLDPPFALPPAVDASPLGRLRDALGLTLFETALLALALLPELDEDSEVAIGYLQRDPRRTCPTLGLALRLFAPDDPVPLRGLHVLEPEAPLRAWEVLDPPPDEATIVRHPLRLERALRWRLLGADAPDPAIAGLMLGRTRVIRGTRRDATDTGIARQRVLTGAGARDGPRGAGQPAL